MSLIEIILGKCVTNAGKWIWLGHLPVGKSFAKIILEHWCTMINIQATVLLYSICDLDTKVKKKKSSKYLIIWSLYVERCNFFI